MNNAVLYKGVWLAKGSDARELHDKGDFQKLDKHMKALDQKEKDLIDRYTPKEKKESNG